MSFMNKFLNAMRLDDEPDDYDDEYDGGYDETYEENGSAARKAVKKPRTYEDDYEPAMQKTQPRQRKQQQKVIQMRTIQNNNVNMEVCVIKPSTVEDGREISDTLLSGRAVVLNLEGLQMSIAQRIIDFTSGACYSINGNLQKVSNYIFVITPEAVEISGDFQDLLNSGANASGFDVTFRSE